MELHELLVQFGYTRSFTKVLVYCTQHKNEDIRLHDVERATDLRQPEVSIAMNNLVKCKWIKVKTLPAVSGTLGHPGKSYHLVVSAKWIAEHIASEIYERINNDKKLAEDIRAAMKG